MEMNSQSNHVVGGVALVAKLCWTLATPWTVAGQAPLSVGFSQQEYWSGLPFPPPGDLPNPGIKSGSLALQADSLLSESPGKPTNVKSFAFSYNKTICSLCLGFPLEPV